MDNYGIQGLTFAGQGAGEPPIILVIGKEKCFRGNTLVLDPRSGKRITIEEIVKQLKSDARVLTPNGLISTLEGTTPTRFTENPPAQLYRLRTQTGFEIEVTADHQMATQRGWVALKDLNAESDRIVTVAQYPDEIFWTASYKDDDNWIKILAYLIADGGLGYGSNPIFTKNEEIVREDFNAAVESFGDSVSVYENPSNGVIAVRVKARSGRENRTMTALRELGLDGSKAATKFIPEFIFGAGKKKIALFLNRLFTCDGSVEASGKISYSSTSLRLIQDVRHLLARFGIVGTVRDRFRDDQLYGREIIIASRVDVVRFADEIGMYGEKGLKLTELRSRAANEPTSDVGTQLWRQGPYLFDRIQSIEPTVIEPTFDLTIAGTHCLIASDMLVHNCGKSTLALTLYDWPQQGNRPLVLAFDALGFDSVAQFSPCPGIKVKDQPGNTFWDKTNAAITNLENVFRSGRQTPFSSILVDCGSTMVDKFLQEAQGTVKGDPRRAFGDALNKSNQVLWRLIELGKPLIWLAWLKEGFTESSGSGQQKRSKTVLGGAQIEGSFRAKLTGKATQVMILEKSKQGAVQGADSEGYVRQFHTRTYDNVEAGGRLSQYLPEPCPANLAYVLHLLSQRGQSFQPGVMSNGAQAQVTAP